MYIMHTGVVHYDWDEVRFITLGKDMSARLLLVVWAERAGNRVRIISARKASPGEADRYHGG